MGLLQFFQVAGITLFGMLLIFGFLWLFALFDTIRDKRFLWFFIILLSPLSARVKFWIPIIILLVYWIFGNKPSGRRKRKIEKKIMGKISKLSGVKN